MIEFLFKTPFIYLFFVCKIAESYLIRSTIISQMRLILNYLFDKGQKSFRKV